MCEEIKGTVPEIHKCVCGGTAFIRKGEGGYSARCQRDPGFVSVPVFPSQKKAIRAWNKAQDEMDLLTVCAVSAYHNRKRYGQYMAALPEKPPAVRYPKKQAAVDTVLELHCIHCGELIPADCKSKKYCSEECAVHYREKQKRIRNKLAAELVIDAEPEPRYCALCGRPIPADVNRYKYCSEECAVKAGRIQSAEYNRIRRAKKR